MAAETPAASYSIDKADTVWVLLSTALVMFMTPGLAFFYGGMVKRKNVLGIFMQCFMSLGVLGLLWVIIGYSLSFAPGNGFIGGLQWFGLKGVGMEPYAPYSATIPHMAFMIFQLMFAVITPALIIGAFAERIRFPSFIAFIVLWSFLVYYPVCHWVWGEGGWLKQLGVLDFAGGIVVHITAGFAAIVMAIAIGRRKGHFMSATPHNLPFTVLGTAMLWFGWFGFNAGSSLSAGNLAVNAFITTNTSALAAAVTWAVIEWIMNGRPTMLGTATGAIAGLATITPASGFVGVMPSMIIGITTSIVCFFAVSIIKPKLGYDDTLDAFGVHGMGGLYGSLVTGLFASLAINPAGANGLFFGNYKQLFIQSGGVFAVIAYTIVMTMGIYKLIDLVLKMRVEDKGEQLGLDLSEHNERAYTLVE